jgi:dipeptidyl aminopeptidase/acylaminoacyl peptidase
MVTEIEESVSSPVCSRGSKRVLFTSKVWLYDKPETDVKSIKRIKYKLNGVGFFEGRRSHLFSVRLGQRPKQVTDGEFDVEAPAWNTDGKSIAFVARMGEDADTSRVKDIFLKSLKRGEPVKVTQGKYYVSSVSFSPDSERLAFMGHDRPNELAVFSDLWVMSLDSGEAVNLTRSLDKALNMTVGSDLWVSTPKPGPVWNHDGTWLYFTAASIPFSNIHRVPASGGPIEDVTTCRAVDSFSLGGCGDVLAFNSMSALNPAELYVLDSRGETRLTGFNDQLLKSLELAEPERFTFVNALGGEIDGWVIKPLGSEEGEKYPTVLEIHGGPAGLYGDGIFHEFQALAASGYGVIYTNPRGSSGYGEEYGRAVMGHYGECDYEDLIDFVDAALERFPFIDEERLGVTGGSYGGYMTNWIISHTDRFSSAVTFRSICNWVSKLGVSDIGFMQPKSISGRDTFWGEDAIEQLKHSPIFYAGDVKTPCLIIHSEEDHRCPIEQAEQWFTALKLRDVPTELVRFPDENHDLSRSGKPKHREERLRHMLRWFNKYLKKSMVTRPQQV